MLPAASLSHVQLFLTPWAAYTHTHTHVYTYMYMCVHTCMYIHTCTHIYIHICICVCTYVYTTLQTPQNSLLHVRWGPFTLQHFKRNPTFPLETRKGTWHSLWNSRSYPRYSSPLETNTEFPVYVYTCIRTSRHFVNQVDNQNKELSS